jgi:hypothetical protein
MRIVIEYDAKHQMHLKGIINGSYEEEIIDQMILAYRGRWIERSQTIIQSVDEKKWLKP